MSHEAVESGHTVMVERSLFRTLGVWIVVALCLAVSLATLAALGKSRKKKPTATTTPPPVVTVNTTRADYQTLTDELVATGTVRAVDPLSVGSEVNGLRIVSVDVEEGSSVRRGQVLATLNRSILDAQLNQSRARYQGTLAQIGKAVQPNRPQDLNMLESGLAQARASEEQERANLRQAQTNLDNARRTAERYSKVLEEGFVTAQEAQERAAEVARNRDLVSAAQQRLQATHFSMLQARDRLDLGRAGGRAEDVQLAQSNSQEVAANIDLIQAQADQTVIRAPDDGIVLQRDAHLGDIVSTGKPLFTIARLGQMELRAQVPEIDLNRIKVGDTTLTSVGGKNIRGRVWMISPAVDPATRLGTVRVLLDRPTSRQYQLLPGMFARASLRLGSHKALVVPGTAVLGENDHYFVFLLEEGRARKVAVVPGVRSKDVVEIKDGLKPNARVIVNGAGFLSDGDAVAVSEK